MYEKNKKNRIVCPNVNLLYIFNAMFHNTFYT